MPTVSVPVLRWIAVAALLLPACDGDDDDGNGGGSTSGTSGAVTSSGVTPDPTDASADADASADDAGTTGGDSMGTDTGSDSGDAGSDDSESGGSEADTGEPGVCEEQTGECADILAEFEACGGDPTGTWEIQTLCHVLVGQENPDCAGQTFSLGVVGGSGTVVLDGETIAFTDYNIVEYGESVTPAECLMPGFTCDVLEMVTQKQWGDSGCCEELDDGTCACRGSAEAMLRDSSGAYVVRGSTISIDEGPPGEFCVEGGVLQIRSDAGTDDETVIYMTRA